MEGKFFEKQVVTHKMTKQRTTLYDSKILQNFYKLRNANREAKLKEFQNSEKDRNEAL